MNMMWCAKFQEIVKCTYNQSLSPHAIALPHSTSQPFIQQSSANHGYVSFALVISSFIQVQLAETVYPSGGPDLDRLF
jgi:hypothetical protein